MSEYKIVKGKTDSGFTRFEVKRKNKKEITNGVLGYYFNNLFSAEEHLKLIENGKWFIQNNIKRSVSTDSQEEEKRG